MKAKVLLLEQNLKTQCNLEFEFERAGFEANVCSTWVEATRLTDTNFYDFVILEVQDLDSKQISNIKGLLSSQEKDCRLILTTSKEIEDEKVVSAVRELGASRFLNNSTWRQKIISVLNEIVFSENCKMTNFEQLSTMPNWSPTEFQLLYNETKSTIGYELPFVFGRISMCQMSTSLQVFQKGELAAVIHFVKGDLHRVDLYKDYPCDLWKILVCDMRMVRLAEIKVNYDYSREEVLTHLERDKHLSRYMASTAKNLCTLKKLAGLISDENFNLKFQKLTTVEANLNLSKEEFKGWLSECIETQVPALWLSEIFRNLCLFSPVRSDLVYKDNFTSEVQLVDELIIRGMGSCHSLLKLRLSNLFDETQLLKDFYRLCSWGVIWFNEGAKEENPEVVKEFLQRKLRHQDSDPFLLLDIYKNVTREECINFVKKDLYWLESYRELSLDKLINSYHQAVEKYIKRTNSEFLLPELNKAISDSSSHKNFQKQRVEQRVEDLLKLGNYKVAKALMYDRLMNGEVTPRTRLLMLWLEMAQKSRAHQQQSFRFRLSSELEELKKFEGYKPIFHYVSYLYHKKLKNDRLARMSMLTLKALDENYLPTQSSRWLHHVHGKLRQGLFNLGRTVKSRYSEAL